MTICLAAGASAGAGQDSAAKTEARSWLEKALVVAEKMDNTPAKFGPSPRTQALEEVAGAYLDLGDLDKAKAIAAKLPEGIRGQSFRSWIPIGLAHLGRYDEAVREAEAVNDRSSWRVVCAVIGKKDLPKAFALMQRVPETRDDWVCESITRDHVLADDLKGAQEAASRVQGDKTKEIVARWLAAGRYVQGGKDDSGAAIDPATIQDELSSIAEAKAKAGDVEKAEQILTVLKDADCRCRVHISLSEAYLKGNQEQKFHASVTEALKEASAIDDPVMGALQRAARYLSIAQLQVKAGDFDEAMKTLALADKSGKEEAKQWGDLGVKSGGVWEGLGGKKAVVGLMILAGKMDEAVKMSTQEDGSLLPEAVPLLAQAYAAKGMSGKLAELQKKAKGSEVEFAIDMAVAQAAVQKVKEEARK